MAVSSVANSHTFKVTNQSDREIVLTRLFDAPRHLVFEAMTRPEHIKRWWGRLGDGYDVPVCEVDLRVGGTYCFVARMSDGTEHALSGVYRDIVTSCHRSASFSPNASTTIRTRKRWSRFYSRSVTARPR